MYGFTRLPSGPGAGLLAAGLAGLTLFFRWERKAEHPVLDVRLFARNRVFAFSNLAALINYSSTSAVGFLLSLYLQYIKGMKPQEAGLVLIAQPVIMTLFSPLAGKVSDRIEPRVVASVGMAISGVGLLLLTFVSGASSIGFIAGSLALLGFGFALFSSPNTNAVMGSVEKKHYGIASATLATMRLTGQMGSLGIAMMLFALFIGPRAVTPEYHPHFLRSAHAGFIIFAVLCLAGVFASLARGNRNVSGSAKGNKE
jgi:MFS family permease